MGVLDVIQKQSLYQDSSSCCGLEKEETRTQFLVALDTLTGIDLSRGRSARDRSKNNRHQVKKQEEGHQAWNWIMVELKSHSLIFGDI